MGEPMEALIHLSLPGSGRLSAAQASCVPSILMGRGDRALAPPFLALLSFSVEDKLPLILASEFAKSQGGSGKAPPVEPLVLHLHFWKKSEL